MFVGPQWGQFDSILRASSELCFRLTPEQKSARPYLAALDGGNLGNKSKEEMAPRPAQ
jgi:hypothetical protein